MATWDYGFTLTTEKFTLSHGGDGNSGYAELGNPTIEGGSEYNIIDGNAETNMHLKNYSGSASHVYEHFYITPNYHVKSIRLKISTDHKLNVSYTRLNGTSVTLADGVSSIDTTYDIRAGVSKIYITADKNYGNSSYNDPLDVYFYLFDMDCYLPSELHGYDGTEIVQFADSLNDDTELRYRDRSNNIRSVLLVDASSSSASKFRIMTRGGIKALARYD